MQSVAELLEKAFTAFDEGALEDAARYYRQVLSHAAPSSDLDIYERALHGLGFVNSHQGDFVTARHLYQELLECAKTRGDPRATHIALHQLGMVERLAGHYDAALRLFCNEHALIVRHFPQHHVALAANLYEQGYTAFRKGDLTTGDTHLHDALLHANQADDTMCRACVLRGLGEIAAARGERRRALERFQKSQERFVQVGDARAASDVQTLIDALPTT